MTDEVYTAAKASSIGSTDKRSMISSDSFRKRDILAITQPTMNFHGSNNGGDVRAGVSEFANNAINMRTASPFRSTIVQKSSDVVNNGIWQEAKGQDFS